MSDYLSPSEERELIEFLKNEFTERYITHKVLVEKEKYLNLIVITLILTNGMRVNHTMAINKLFLIDKNMYSMTL